MTDRTKAQKAADKHHIANRALRKARSAPKKKRRIPKVAPTPTYGAASGSGKKTKPKKKPSVAKRLFKALKGDYLK